MAYKDSDSLNNARNCDHLIVGLEPGKCSRKELELLNQQYKLLNLKPEGIVLIKANQYLLRRGMGDMAREGKETSFLAATGI